MTPPEERLYHARWALMHLITSAAELQQAIDHLEHACSGIGDTPALTSLRVALGSTNQAAEQLRGLVHGALATAARAALAQTAPARNACCGNVGTVRESGREHCATCGQEIP